MFSEHRHGVILTVSNHTIIRDNLLVDNSPGIQFHNSYYNQLNYNTIKNGNYYAILLFHSSYNFFHLNNFMDNNQIGGNSQAVDWNLNNRWNRSSTGNYWSDWKSPDNNSDGIVDIPYKIRSDSNVKDYFPLTSPVGSVPPSKNQPPMITTINVMVASVGKYYSVNYTATDPNTPQQNLTWSMSTNASWLSFSSNQELYGTPTKSDVGSYWVNISVSDGKLIDFTNFTLSVNNKSKPKPPIPTKGPVFNVRTGERSKKIQDAINNASAGDTIRVWAGIYYENIVINKKLYLIGNGSSSTEINGSQSGTVITINANGCNIRGFNITNCSSGSPHAGLLIKSDYNYINNCKFYNNGYHGLKIKESNYNQILNCNFDSNWGWGIGLSDSNHNEILTCKVIKNLYTGISLAYSRNNRISNCSIIKNIWGIYLFGSSFNTITNNTIKENIGWGIRASNDKYNSSLIFNNNFINNNNGGKQASEDHGMNFWNTSTKGNYWSDWTGPDKNNDGIVDLPYNISGGAGAKDYFPLTKMIFINYSQPPVNATPKVLNTNVLHNSYNVSVNTSELVITFSLPMNTTSIEASLKISPNINYTLKWEKNNTVLRIIFNNDLSYNTTYKISINNINMDLDSPFELVFTTEPQSGGKPEDHQEKGNLFTSIIYFAAIIFVLIIIIIVTFAVITKNRRKEKERAAEKAAGVEERKEFSGGKIAEEIYYDSELEGDSETLIEQLKDRALSLKKPSEFGPSQEKKFKSVQDKYRKGEISKDTYDSILEIMGKQD
jgi:parallel beta-helix repeat protein